MIAISYTKRFSPEVTPIIVITGAAVCGAGWYLTRLARQQDVIWDKKVGRGSPDCD